MAKVLVVDDESLEREVLKSILSKNDKVSEIFTAKNGKEALEVNREEDLDLILMDVKMPGINGIKALELIRNEYPNRKVIMITAYDDFELIHKVLVLGGSDYILKPIKPEKINSVVNNIIDKNKINNDIESINQKSIESQREDSIVKAKKYIKENINKPLKLEEVAFYCNLSSGYFSRLFKNKTGKTVIAYISEQKINKAKKMLEDTEMPIINISLDLGFEDCGYFIRVFKKNTGITPKMYRNKIKRK